MGRHQSHRMHKNSIESHKQYQPNAGTREAAIVDQVRRHGPSTDRYIARLLGFSDMNMVRPSITNLRDRGVLIECGRVRDGVTNRVVRVVKLAEAA
jgi:hypothetical protein